MTCRARLSLVLFFFACSACGVDAGAPPGDAAADVDAPLSAVTTLATISGLARDLAVDETHVYWLEQDSVWRVLLSGGVPELVARGREPASFWSLALDATHVYWTDSHDAGGSVERALKVGPGAAELLVDTGPATSPLGIAVAGPDVLWTQGSGGPGLFRAPTAGGAAERLGTLWARSVVATPTHAYASGINSQVVRVSLSSFAVDELSPGSPDSPPYEDTVDMAVAQGFLWYLTSGHAPEFRDGALRRIPLEGGAPETIVSGLVDTTSLAADEAAVCWTENEGGAGRVACIRDGTTSLTAIALVQFLPSGIALDATHVYWLVYGEVRSAPR